MNGTKHSTVEDENGSSGGGSDVVDDLSMAFFDSALLDTLFYNEMMKDDDTASTIGGVCSENATNTMEEVVAQDDGQVAEQSFQPSSSNATTQSMAPNPGAVDPSIQKPDSSLQNRHGSAQQTQCYQPYGSGNPTQQNQYYAAAPYTPSETQNIPHQHSPSAASFYPPLAPRLTSSNNPPPSIRPSSSISSGMNDAQIASLQEDYRKGMAAAAMLSKRPSPEYAVVSTPVPFNLSQSNGYVNSNPPAVQNFNGTNNPILPQQFHQPPHYSQHNQRSIPYQPQASVQTHQQTFPQTQYPQTQQPQPQQQAFHQPQTPAIPHASITQSITGNVNFAPVAIDNEDEEATKLVSQFASLASQLGINLPKHVISSLTTAAALNKASAKTLAMVATDAGGTPSELPLKTAAVPPVPPISNSMVKTIPLPPSSTVPQAIPLVSNTALVGTQPSTSSVAMTSGPIPVLTTSVGPVQQNFTDVLSEVHCSEKEDNESLALHLSPSAQQIEETANAAIEAVQKRRSAAHESPSHDDKSGPDIQSIVDQDPSKSCELTLAASLTNQDAGSVGSGGMSGNAHRKRKRPRVDECEAKLAALRDENRLLKRHLDNVLKKTQSFDTERALAERKMREMILQSGQDGHGVQGVHDQELRQLLTRFTEMYSDYGKTRQQELKFHLQQLKKLATPTTFTKMSLWTLGQNDQFFHNPKRNSLGAILMKELQISPAQAKKIVERRDRVHSLSTNIKEALDLLEKLRKLCEGKQRVFHDRMSKVQDVLSPIQVVKLLTWVDDNSQVLEQVCPGWGSERIRVSSAKKNATQKIAQTEK